jgi:hypothetical protein
LAASVRCESADRLALLAEEVRGDAGWVFVHRTADRLLTARGTTQRGGDVLVQATLRAAADGEPWQALLPARGAPAAPVLADAGALMHLRLRSDRGAAAFAKLGQGDWSAQLFGLREKVFLAMDLEGTIEVAVFEPAPGELIPPLAAALHVRRPRPAAESMESLIAGLRSRWGVARRPWRLGNAEGACLDDLNVLPDLAPCYVATERALVVGWNRGSVARARAAAPSPQAGASSQMLGALDRFPEADRRLRAAYHSRGGAPARYAWSRATVSGVRRWSTYHLDLALRAAGGTGP